MDIEGTVLDPLSGERLEWTASDTHPDAFIRDRVYVRVIDRMGVEKYSAIILSLPRDEVMRSNDEDAIGKEVIQRLITFLPSWTVRVRHEPGTTIPVVVAP